MGVAGGLCSRWRRPPRQSWEPGSTHSRRRPSPTGDHRPNSPGGWTGRHPARPVALVRHVSLCGRWVHPRGFGVHDGAAQYGPGSSGDWPRSTSRSVSSLTITSRRLPRRWSPAKPCPPGGHLYAASDLCWLYSMTRQNLSGNFPDSVAQDVAGQVGNVLAGCVRCSRTEL